MKKRFGVLAVTTALLAACHSAPPPPVPVSGDAAGLAHMAGDWAGSYESVEIGRGGSIVFTLQAGEDHAHGDIVMIPRGQTSPLRPARQPAGLQAFDTTGSARVLTIDFVRVRGDSVSGTLETYADPDCGCSANAAFRGRLEGNTIRGTFIVRRTNGDRPARGTWSVRRSL